MASVESIDIYKTMPEHQSLPLILPYFGSDVKSDTSLFRKGPLIDGQ